MYKKESYRWLKHIDFIAIDLICLIVSFWIAYIIRHGIVLDIGALEPYFTLVSVLTFVDVLISIMNSSFKNVLKRGKFVEFKETIKHVLIVEAIGIVYIFTVKEGITYSRAVIYYLAVVYLIISYLVRLSWKKVVRKWNLGSVSRSLLIITYQHLLDDTLAAVMGKNYENFRLAGLCLLDADRAGEKIKDMSIVANTDTVVEYIRTEWIDEVLIRIPITEEYPKKLVEELTKMGVVTHYAVLDGIDVEEGPKKFVGRIGRFSVVTTSINYMTQGQILGKRVLDILGGMVGCIFMLLALMVVGPAIKILSPGPVFFAQERVGKNGKKFRMYKFRSMYMDAEERKKELMEKNRISGGLMFKMEDDPRIIGNKLQPDGTMKKGFGHYLRSWSIDELPQFINVLKGDMSLVGTRPPTVDEWEKYELHHRARLSIKPGLTGMWQVSGRSQIIDFEEVVKLDTAYICDWSFGLDLKILVKTILVVLGKEGSM